MLLFLFVIALTLGIISVRARLMGQNGGVAPSTRLRSLASTLAAFLTVAIVVWALLTFVWYWPLAAFLVANLVIIALVSNGAWPTLCRAVPAIDAVVVVLTLALWIGHWPFR
ncbi:MAG TPA: hypothetical protein VJL90_03845 [Pseudorhodoplanes sp.]|nr:hypothetical protein [Pseudorhodoplanes sp.]